MTPRPDRIAVRDLWVTARIGVPEEERATPQRLAVSLEFTLSRHAESMGDDLSLTADYFALTRSILDLAAARPRKLIETLAADIATAALEDPAITAVSVEVKKFILPDATHVSVRLDRARPVP